MAENQNMGPTLTVQQLLEQGHSYEEIQELIKQASFAGVIGELMAVHDMTVDMVAGAAEIDPATIYRFMKQERKPSRNALLRIALAMELNMEETQRLLKSGNCSTLSGTRNRDLVIMEGIVHKKDFVEVNEALTKHGFEDLNKRG